MKYLSALLLTLMLTTPALAVPYTYEFTSGSLTGQFTLDLVTVGPEVQGTFTAWHLMPPIGPVWDATNLTQQQFDNSWHFNHADLALISSWTDPVPNFGLTVNDIGVLFPDSTSGTYHFLVEDTAAFTEGIGNWSRVTQSVPLPDMLWPTVLGLVALGMWRYKGKTS